MIHLSHEKQDNNFEQALQQLFNAQLRGQPYNVEELVKQHPEHEDEIRNRIRKLLKINNLFDSIAQADERDFCATANGQDLTGQRIGNFEVVEIIGRGGMGVVYLARDTKLKRSVAIKSIPAEFQANQTARTRFRCEAELLASLNHSNIAVIHEIIEEEKTGHLILEYVQGETLAERIARQPLTLEEVLSIGLQIAEGISAAHEKGVIHRDLKPSNIKITPEGRVKVLDFGLAKAHIPEEMADKTTVNQPGRVMGTPAYMSPEQARGKKIDHRTDIWSFGCILFQMLTGRLPFEGETATDTLAKIIEREPNWEALPQSTPMAIRVLLQSCLKKDLSHRLGHISEAVTVINETLNEPARSSSVAITPKLKRTVIIAGVILVLILVGITAWYVFDENEIVVAVLPSKIPGSNLDEGDVFSITVGITDHLAKIEQLSVKSHRSVMYYKQTEKDVDQIAKDLGLSYILDVSVHHDQSLDPASQIIIETRLIRVSNDFLVWTDSCHFRSNDQIYQELPSIAAQAAEEMGIKLQPKVQQALAYKPTENSKAQAYFSRGNFYSSQGYDVKSNIVNAINLYKKAVKEDDRFALAWAKLSHAHSGMWWFDHDLNKEDRLKEAEIAMRKAMDLNQDLPETHWAQGFYYYWGFTDYDRAMDHFLIARNGRPNDSQLIAAMGYVQRRKGQLEEALKNIKIAHCLSPTDPFFATEVGMTLLIMREYTEAAKYCKKAIEYGPENPNAYEWLACIHLRHEGNVKEAKRVLNEALKKVATTDVNDIMYWLAEIDVYEGSYQDALGKIGPESENIDSMDYNKALRCAQIYRYMFDKAKEEKSEIFAKEYEEDAKKYFESARKNIEKKLKNDLNNSWLLSNLGIAYAGLGEKYNAIMYGKQAKEKLRLSKNSWRGTFPIEFLAKIYVMVGQNDGAIEQIKILLKNHGRLSPEILKLDPIWDPLREHTDFKQLLESDN